MSLEKVVINDTYMVDMSEYFEIRGKRLQETVDSYINIIKRVVEEGISSGETSDSIRRFLTYAEQLNQVISDTSREIRDATGNCLEEINEQERYLY